MRKDVISFKPVYSSFLSCDKDVMQILKSLFVTSKPYSDLLKRLLIINNKDCLDTFNTDYQKIIDSFQLSDLIENGYIKLDPKIARGTHEEIKSYISVTLDGFTPNIINSAYMDYNIFFDVICYNDAWVLNDYKIRPLMICGYIDGILNSLTSNNVFSKTHEANIKLSGIGEYQLIGCNQITLNEFIISKWYTIQIGSINFT